MTNVPETPGSKDGAMSLRFRSAVYEQLKVGGLVGSVFNFRRGIEVPSNLPSVEGRRNDEWSAVGVYPECGSEPGNRDIGARVRVVMVEGAVSVPSRGSPPRNVRRDKPHAVWIQDIWAVEVVGVSPRRRVVIALNDAFVDEVLDGPNASTKIARANRSAVREGAERNAHCYLA